MVNYDRSVIVEKHFIPVMNILTQKEIIAKLKKVGITKRELFTILNRPYGVIAAWLKGTLPMPFEIRECFR